MQRASHTMRIGLWIFMLAGASTIAAAANNRAIALDVTKKINSYSELFNRKAGDSAASYRKTKTSNMLLEVEVRNLKPRPVALKVYWWFMAKPVQRGPRKFIKTGWYKLALPGRGKNITSLSSPEVKSFAGSFFSNIPDPAGVNLAGYAVLVESGGRILKTFASSRGLAAEAETFDRTKVPEMSEKRKDSEP